MQAGAKLRQPPGAAHSVGRRRPRHHQACRGQNAVAMRDLDGLVDLKGEAEIVGRDDQTPQSAASRRSFRNWKNSTPSRSRRFIICGERTISLTMAAIFGARK